MCSIGSGVYTTIAVPAPGQCPTERNEVRKLTPAAAGVATYKRNGDGHCVATTETSRANWMVPGQVVGPELFVAGELIIVSRPGWSIGVQRVVAVDGAYLNLSPADIERNAPCTEGQVTLTGSDGDRCIPTVHAGDASPQAARYYADRACTKPLALHDGCEKPTTGVHRDPAAELSVHRLGAVHDGAVYRTDYENRLLTRICG